MIVRALRIQHTQAGRKMFWNQNQLVKEMPALKNVEIPVEPITDDGYAFSGGYDSSRLIYNPNTLNASVDRRHHGHHRRHGGGYYPYYEPYGYPDIVPIYIEPEPQAQPAVQPPKSKYQQLVEYFGQKKADELVNKHGVDKAYKKLPANLQVSFSVDGQFGDPEFNGWINELSKNGKPAIKAILYEMEGRFWRYDVLRGFVPRYDPNFVYASVQLLYHLNQRWDALSKTNVGIGRIKYVCSLISSKMPEIEKNTFDASVTGILANTLKKTVADLAKIPKIAFDVIKWLPFIIIGAVGLVGFGVYKFLKSDTGKQIIHGTTMGVARKYLPISARVGRGKRRGSRRARR